MKKDEVRIKIKKDTAEFLAKGGVIKKIPKGYSTVNPHLTHRKSRAIAIQKILHDKLFTDNNSNDTDNT